MKPQTVLLLALITVLAVPLTADARSAPQARSYAAGDAPPAKKPAAPMYECSICHHQVGAAQAKELHYICPVDHGKLIPVKSGHGGVR